MRLDESQFIPPRDIKLLEPLQIISYLRANGWTERTGAGRGALKVFYRTSDRTMEAAVPIVLDLAHREDTIARTIAVIARFEERSQSELYSDLLFYSDDVVHLGDISPDTSNGTVPFSRADSLYAGLRKTLLSAAHLETGEPQQHYAKLQKAEAKSFVDKCRLGQTKMGSYIMTVACPLGAVPSSQPMLTGMEEGAVPPFTRRVVSRIMSSVQLIAQCAEADDLDSALQTAEPRTVISTNLCDGLLQLLPVSAGSEVSIGAQWGKKVPPPATFEPPALVTLKYSYRQFVESVRDRIRSSHVSDTRQVFLGRVDSLSGDVNDDGVREGTVHLNVLDEESLARRVRVSLNSADHHAAVEAYDKNLAVSISGVLRISGSDTYRIDDHSGFQIVRTTTSTN